MSDRKAWPEWPHKCPDCEREYVDPKDSKDALLRHAEEENARLRERLEEAERERDAAAVAHITEYNLRIEAVGMLQSIATQILDGLRGAPAESESKRDKSTEIARSIAQEY